MLKSACYYLAHSTLFLDAILPPTDQTCIVSHFRKNYAGRKDPRAVQPRANSHYWSRTPAYGRHHAPSRAKASSQENKAPGRARRHKQACLGSQFFSMGYFSVCAVSNKRNDPTLQNESGAWEPAFAGNPTVSCINGISKSKADKCRYWRLWGSKRWSCCLQKSIWKISFSLSFSAI